MRTFNRLGFVVSAIALAACTPEAAKEAAAPQVETPAVSALTMLAAAGAPVTVAADTSENL